MIRIVLVLLLVFFVAGIARKLLTPATAGKDDGTGEKLVQCDQCGVYITELSAVANGSRYYCSEEHRQRSLR